MKRLLCLPLAMLCLLLAACVRKGADEPALESTGKMELVYAENYCVDYVGDGAALLTLGGRERFLLLSDGAEVPREAADLPVIPVPVKRVYLASSSAADLFLQCGALDSVRFTSTNADSWQIPELCGALEKGNLLYIGKYSAPDYELLLEEDCDLVVENTMILHQPETREKLEALGFPVLLEYSSYEPHPIGRVEWIKLYGLLTGTLPEAEDFFNRQLAAFQKQETAEPSGKTVAFFHITANGAVVVRRQADYVTRMIQLAGGETAITDLPESDSALSTASIQMESFYAQARDADVLIYNSTIGGELEHMDELLALSPLLADFRAVQEGEVWCTELSMFQRSSAAAEMITELREILSETPQEENLNYLHRVR